MAAIPVFTQVKGAEADGGRVRDRFFDLTFVTDGVNSNYVVAGLTIPTRAAGGMVNIFTIMPAGHATPTGVAQTDLFILSWDYKTNKLQIFGDAVAGTGLNELGAVDISGLTFRVRVIGV
jgi:hypothetical protein